MRNNPRLRTFCKPHQLDTLQRAAGAITLFLLLPFGLKSLFVGHYHVAITLLVFYSLVLLNIWRLNQDKPVLIPYPVLALIMSIAVLAGIYNNGASVAIWAFPLSLVFVIFLDKKMAAVFNLLLALGIAFALKYFADYPLISNIRLCASLLTTYYIGSLLLNYSWQMQLQLQQQIRLDPLTGLYHRQQITQLLPKAWQQCQAKQHQAFLAEINILNFKQINEQQGYAAGDTLLKNLAKALEKQVGQQDLIFRLEADRFLLFAQLGHNDKPEKYIKRLQACCDELTALEETEVAIKIALRDCDLAARGWLDLLYQTPKKQGKG